MAHPNLIEEEKALAEIVRGMKRAAVVGMKDESRSDQPAFEIPQLMVEHGIDVVPVNPTIERALGRPAVATLADVTGPTDVVQAFRRSDRIPELADEILALPEDRRPAVVWLQSGIRHDEAATRLAEAGMRVVQDRCLGVYAARYRR